MTALYDTIGRGYARTRREDPRIAARIRAALGTPASVVNVGAGTGSYEPRDRAVVAVEPSAVMARQRPPGRAPVVRARAEQLPFRDARFGASLAVLTIHHWHDLARGLGELRRVAKGAVVLFTFDACAGGFWLTDYFPQIAEMDRRTMPSMARLRQHLGPVCVRPVPVPHDCADGFLGAYWRRPHAYLDPAVRAGISIFSKPGAAEAGLCALRADLESGAWHRRYGHLLHRTQLDIGYRLVVA